MTHTENFISIARDYLSAKRPDAYEVYLRRRNHFLADSKEGRVELFERATEFGLAVRVINGQKMGFSYTTSLTVADIKSCVDRAIEAGRVVDSDEAWIFAEPKDAPCFACCRGGSEGISDAAGADAAKRLEAATLSFDERIRRIRHAVYEESRVETRIVNSKGIDLSYNRSLFEAYVLCVAESEGETERASDYDFSTTFNGLDVGVVAKRAAEEAVSFLGSRRLPTMRTPACLHPSVASSFLGVLIKGFYGENIFKKKSALVGKLGKKVYSDLLTVTDDGLLADGYNSSPFDDEGVPQGKTCLVDGGKIESWLTDLYWGGKLGCPSTGSSCRQAITMPPGIGSKNVYIKPGGMSREELLAGMKKGFYVTEVIGVHSANPVTGDFSVGAAGQWVEGGVIKYPVKGVVIAGNMHDIFRDVSQVANDLRFFSNVGAPTVMISNIQVSGG